MSRLRALSAELKRRRVYRLAALYAGAAFVVVEGADLFLPRLGLPDWIVTAVVILAVLGFPAAVALAWAFDVTPEGLRRTEDVGNAWRAAPRRLVLAAAVLAVVVVGGGWWISSAIGVREPVGRLAVLPLLNLMNDPEQAYFVEGVHDALISELARAGLPVLARTSVMRYRESEEPVRRIADELGVGAVVEGSVLRMGDQVRVQARLVDAETEEHLWTQSYDGDLADMLAVNRRITRAIAEEVHVALAAGDGTGLAEARRLDPAAYDEYLRGMHAVRKFTPEGFRDGIRHLQRAVDLDPADPLPHAGLANVYATIGHSPSGTRDDLDRAEAAAMTALELDPALPLAHAVLAEIRFYKDWDVPAAGVAFRRALALDPSMAATRAHYAWWLQLNGDLDAAVVEMERAREADPLEPTFPAWHAWMLWWAGVPPATVIPHARTAVELAPDFPVGLAALSFLLAETGDQAAAIEAGRRALEANPVWGSWALGYAYALGGRRDDAHAMIDQLSGGQAPTVAWALAEIHAALGENDEAIRWLECAYEARFNWLVWLATAPTFASLRDDPRFQDLVRRVGWPPRPSPAPVAVAADADV